MNELEKNVIKNEKFISPYSCVYFFIKQKELNKT